MYAAIAAPVPSASPSRAPSPATERPGALELPEQLGRDVAVKRDQTLFWEGDPATSYHRVVSGAVRISKLMADGRRQVADFFSAGDIVIVDFADKYHFTGEAIVDSVIRRYPRSAIWGLVQSDPRFSRQLLALACSRLTSAHHQMMMLGRKTAEERVASFLSALAERQPQHTLQIELPMSRTDIADHLGLTVETVSRVLTRLKRQGAIKLPNTHSVTIIDREALQLLCDGAG